MTFRLEASFLSEYEGRRAPFGFRDINGTSLGEITFIRTYSRLKDDGTKETWQDVCQRVIEGMYEIQRRHCERYTLPWDNAKAQRSAQEAYDHLFNLRWTPSGRGLWAMGTPLVMSGNSAPLQSCAFVSTDGHAGDDPGDCFAWMMEASMLGIGVGFDDAGAHKDVQVKAPQGEVITFVVPDTREGWAQSLRLLIESYLTEDDRVVHFDYSEVRPAGSPIRTFGGTASGPEPLRVLHERARGVLDRASESGRLGVEDIADIGNMIGVCVVAGNVRRSSEIFLGSADDETFLSLKDYNSEIGKRRTGWSHLSNNSVIANVDDDLSGLVPRILENGEPGVIFLDKARQFGRLADPQDDRDARVRGTNPCMPAFATVLTRDGIGVLGDVSVGDEIWSEDGWVTVLDKWSTGVKEVFSYKTTAGEVLCTENHRVVSGGVKIEAGDAESMDVLRGPGDTRRGGFDLDDVLAGLIVGDGYFHKATSAYWLCVGARDDYRDIPSDWLGAPPQWGGTARRVLHDMPEGLINSKLPTRVIPERYYTGDAGRVRSFLRGLYSANGSVVRSRVTLKAVSERLVKQVQVMLSSIGIASYVTTNKPSVIEWDNGTYESKQSYDLNIGTAEGVDLFAELVGFLQEYKMERLRAIAGRRGHRGKVTFDISSVESIGMHEVFDITVSGAHHTYWSGGHNVSNCGEIGLEDRELCNLVETFPGKCKNFDQYERVLKFAYLYAKTVTLLPTPWPKTNAVMMRNRRIGTSMSGLADFVDRRGWKLLEVWQDLGYEVLEKYDNIYSEWLAIRDSVKLSTVKPSGCRPWDGLLVSPDGIRTNQEVFMLSGHQEGETWHDVSNLESIQASGEVSSVSKTYDNGMAEVFAVTMHYGMEVRSTANHQWFVSRHGAPVNGKPVGEWVRTDELKPRDVLDVRPGIYRSTVNAKLRRIDARALSMRADASSIKQPDIMNEDIAWMLGYLWGDGAMSPGGYRLRWVDGNLSHLEKASRIMMEQFGLTSEIKKASGGRRAHVLEVSSKHLWHWLIVNDVFKYYADSIDVIPTVVRTSGRNVILAFLAGLCDADGCVYQRSSGKWCLTLASSSELFARHVQDVAAACGIVFGRSLNAKGDNLQRHKKIYLMVLTPESTGDAFDVFKAHSIKASAVADGKWVHEDVHRRTRTLGMVREVRSIGQMPTFDVEVEETHEFMAGAVRSHNSVSLLAGVSPGVHWQPGSEFYWRAVRFSVNDPILKQARESGYRIESCKMDPVGTAIVFFPMERQSPRGEHDVPLQEKLDLAAISQYWWSDNMVSATFSYSDEERGDIAQALRFAADELKGASFLPLSDHGYEQAPYTPATLEELEEFGAALPIDTTVLYAGGVEAVGESGCTTDVCEIK